ncbi:vacuolar protein sorting-associated protein 17 [Xylona heveae TC161]|uniref:Vacuolar protein sorting-associated protein 17 n=1 Tax=Xylona heveae (strain CBS 132557 / TC161) TaxID=1328760 RepID=A0A165H354_XYLHT|nr:vacuolar protein sorting-associated protein 17 [Xylona heveae TC161]KZF22922.1 vacuolar protein sorting-associated protein 17 [Xylona heveae TC161]
MDYSSLPHDPDNPTGASPWSSSPQANRASFPPSSSDGPSSPFSGPSPYSSEVGPGHQPGYSSDQDTAESSAFGRPESAGLESPSEESGEHGKPDLSERLQSPQIGEHDYPGHHQVRQHYQENIRPDPQRYPSGRQPPRQNQPQYKLQAKITGLERTGRKDPILRFDVHTNLPKFRTTQFRDVRRTHSEFVKLAEHLISANPEAIVPAVPPPLTSAGAGTDEDEARVKGSMQRWLNYVCGNEILMRDEEMIFFVESDFGYSPVVRRKQPATGVRRKVIKQFAPPPDDTPELQNARPVAKLFYLGTMETGQKVDKLVKARRALGLAESDLGVKLGTMAVQETHTGLSSAYRKLGKTIQTVGDYHAAQGTMEATTLADPLNYHSSDAFIVKETLTNRHILLRELLQVQQTTRSKLAAADRLKASSSVRREKVDEAIAALSEARMHETFLTRKCQGVTDNLVHECRRWFAHTTNDLRLSIREYVIRTIEAERRTLATLENVRPDIRGIDASGGLSRLGRETHPATRRALMGTSQGPKGDAWSGVPRRPDGLNRSISGGFGIPAPEETDPANGDGAGTRKRAVSGAGSLKDLMEDDQDRVDARNAASRLAQSTF